MRLFDFRPLNLLDWNVASSKIFGGSKCSWEGTFTPYMETSENAFLRRFAPCLDVHLVDISSSTDSALL